ncbi:Lon protease-like protein [Prosthecobacter fusiformis]|uniref:endopeptidase La n=1 Tax=Prosthecobacter fusiformis TaxID=48464 RepID=A0A4R7SSL8_9BACT|nr:S16 family serine protease [Prosthecobacter fusiformis]TDU81775.1 Lon protease-like protein [Prosthecobacter fusiformis]
MKITVPLPWKYLAACYGLISIFSSLPAQGQVAIYKPLVFGQESFLVNSSLRLPAGSYLGSGIVTLKPENNQRSSFEISDSTTIEAAKLVVHEGAQLRVRGAVLRSCQIYAEPGAEVIIESSALDKCEIGGSTSRTGRPTSFRMTNCILQACAWTAPGNALGLEMMDCRVSDQFSTSHLLRMAVGGENTPVTLARRPTIRYTKFINCAIHPTLMLTLSQVTIENCKSISGGGPILFGEVGDTNPEVMLPVRWVNNDPPAPPKIGGGVGLQMILEPISGGCTLTAQTLDGQLMLEGMANATPKPLREALPASVTNGDMATKKDETPLPTPADKPAASTVKLKQAHVNGLLVMPLESGQEAGEVTRMNITAVPGGSSLRFTQSVGEDMDVALREVRKFLDLRHQMPTNMDLEIAFEEKYSDKDGPSAAVACALLVEAVITGKPWDPTFAVTGDMNADGSVQPIGGVAAKLRGATRGSCKIVAVPAKNERAVSDVLVMDGPAPLIAIHIFALEQFDQAVSLASVERPVPLQQGMSEFEVIKSVLMRDPRQAAAILRTPQAVARLQSVLEKAPNSLSAKYLLAYGQGRGPTTLSLSGSLEAADTNALGLVNSIQNDFKGTVSTLKQDELGGTLNRLRNLRPRLDQRVWAYVDALVDYGELVRTEVLNPSRTYAKFNELAYRARQAAALVVSSKKALMTDPGVREDLGL